MKTRRPGAMLDAMLIRDVIKWQLVVGFVMAVGGWVCSCPDEPKIKLLQSCVFASEDWGWLCGCACY